ncbi:MAG: FtsX-like permease family protein [Candidatus Magasanikbacteria bacterium]|nr:FtsX-like permease family protein [Candidatus Magasanikbacteria bacterium]
MFLWLKKFFISIRVGHFLAWSNLKRGSRWTTPLTIVVMTFTFLNVVVVNGILIGLIAGSSNAYISQYSGDVLLTSLPNKAFIQNSTQILKIIQATEGVQSFSGRILEAATVEANYRDRSNLTELPDQAAAILAGINSIDENSLSNLSSLLIAGNYFEPDDNGQIIIGSGLLEEFLNGNVTGEQTIKGVVPGTKIKITLGGIAKEFTVKGIIKSKIDQVNRRIYLVDRELRQFAGRPDYNVDEIAIKTVGNTTELEFKNRLLAQSVDTFATVQTSEESQGKFFRDISFTFELLGNVIGSIGLIVATITLFIVIFINAITRRKFIGILKGVGVDGKAIIISYVMLSVFYAALGITIGLAILYGFLKPYIDVHPINFPFSDGILVAPYVGTAVRVSVIMCTAVVAGLLPAWLVIRKNTLDSILGRN